MFSFSQCESFLNNLSGQSCNTNYYDAEGNKMYSVATSYKKKNGLMYATSKHSEDNAALELEMRCVNNEIMIKAQIFDENILSQNKNIGQIKAEIDGVSFPLSAKNGSSLPDFNFKGEGGLDNGGKLVEIEGKITNRRVLENVVLQTSKGPRSCYVVSSNFEVKFKVFGIKIYGDKGRNKDYFCPQLGLCIKGESIGKNSFSYNSDEVNREVQCNWECPDNNYDYKILRETRNFSSFNDFVSKLKGKKALELAHAYPKWQILKTKNWDGSKVGDSYTKLQGNMVLELKDEYHKVEFFIPTWPNMTDEECNALNKALDALYYHEQGHIFIVEDYITENRYDDYFIEVVCEHGCSRNDIEEKWINKRNAVLRKLEGDVDELAKEYDRITRHGVEQQKGVKYGFPDSPNVLFRRQ